MIMMPLWSKLFVTAVLLVMLVTAVVLAIKFGSHSNTMRVNPAGQEYRIGVNYGFNGDNLPSPKDVVSLYQRCKIPYMRIFEPNHDVLEALRGTEIILSLGTRNEDIQNLASGQDAANAWVNANVQPYASTVKIGWITVGNEAIPGFSATYIGQAMANVHNALDSLGLSSIVVTTVVPMKALSVSYPPSAGTFSNDSMAAMNNIVKYFAYASDPGQSMPLMVNVYPYFGYASDPDHISLDYATFNGKDPVVDGDLKYFNLFDAMVDSFYAALEKINAGNVSIIIAETGWPSAGKEPETSKYNAQMYNRNLVSHLKRGGTPRRPGQLLTAFLFGMFNEDKKPEGVEQNFGLFNPNMDPVYPLLSCSPYK